MGKLQIYILFAFFAIFTASCSKESQIEGLIATKPTVVEINTEILKGTTKTIPLNINGTVINLQVASTYSKIGSTETRFGTLTFQGTTGMFPFIPNTSFIVKAEAGAQPSSPLFNYASYSGYLYYATNTAGTTNYTYVNTNGIQYDNSYYVPIKLIFGSNLTAPIYAYIQITLTAEVLTINKLVYNKVGSVAVGEE